MQLLKQSTASTVYVGPVLDSAGAAVTTAVVGDFRLIKNGTAATLSGATVTHDANGYYTVALTTTNTDTTGRLTLAVGNTAMSMSTHRYSVLLASVYDALITNATNATGGLPTATGSISALAGAISTLTAGGVRTELTTELGRIDAAVSSRMATYTQPTGFLAATFPTTVASPTNITSATGVTLAAVTHTGAVIPTVSAVTGLNASNLDAAVSSRMATYTQPTGFLAATFPTTVASPTNITSATGVTLAPVTHTGAVIPTVSAVTGLNASNLDAAISSRMATYTQPTGFLAATFPTTVASQTSVDTVAGYIDTEVGSIKTVTDRLSTMIIVSGANWKYTTDALSNGPAGGAGSSDWTSDERTAIRSILGVPTSGTTPTDPTVGILDTIRDKTALITPTTVVTTSPVTSTGELRGPILIGDDYLAANGRAFRWTIAAISGITPSTSTARFGGKYGLTTWLVTGTVIDNGNGTWTLSCDMTRTVSGALVPGVYDWSVEIVSNGGTEITPVRSGKPVTVAIKLT